MALLLHCSLLLQLAATCCEVLARVMLRSVQKVLGGILTVFFDDFPLIEPSVSAELFDQMMSKFRTILGWHHATTGKKGLSCAEAFDVLGDRVDFSKLQSGDLEVRNKVGRLERIQRLINEAKKTFPPKKHDMQVIAGLLQYATGNSLGVTLRLCSRVVLRCRQGGVLALRRNSLTCVTGCAELLAWSSRVSLTWL